MSTLKITDLHVSVETDQGTKQILRGVNLEINSGETHAIMGPNGSGKSTLAYTIAGHPKYTIDSGSITLDGVDVLEMSVDERAKAGLFLAMQYPVEVPGVSMSNFLRTAATAEDLPQNVAEAAAAVARHGKLDAMVNNAGWTHRNRPALEVTEDEFDRCYAVNMKSIYLSAIHAVPALRQAGGGRRTTRGTRQERRDSCSAS